ncbi:MAG: DUF2892 domain-containing protein [Flavobacteriaceae bacterium]|nr:MAG: DUF2892 domain-containing protein [Flavobacteriaceae bacterium]
MKQNMGSVDKIVRALFALIVGLLYFFEVISGGFATVLGVLAAIFLITSVVGFCPLYSVFGIRTNKKDQSS